MYMYICVYLYVYMYLSILIRSNVTAELICKYTHTYIHISHIICHMTSYLSGIKSWTDSIYVSPLCCRLNLNWMEWSHIINKSGFQSDFKSNS